MYVRAIRGAITVEENSRDEIINQTIKLMEKIISVNCINTDDIASAVFSVTNDLNAAFPAEAVRKIGWTDIALMCTNEIDVPGSLKKCIRVLVHINTNKSNNDIKHVYLEGASRLRPDLHHGA